MSSNLPAPKIVKTEGIEDMVIEVPLSNSGTIPTSAIPKPKVKKEVQIREVDNGYILNVYSNPFHEEWVFGSLPKAVRAAVAFLTSKSEE